MIAYIITIVELDTFWTLLGPMQRATSKREANAALEDFGLSFRTFCQWLRRIAVAACGWVMPVY